MNHQAGIEVYVAGATNKYVTVTGNRCEDYEYGDRTQGTANTVGQVHAQARSKYRKCNKCKKL